VVGNDWLRVFSVEMGFVMKNGLTAFVDALSGVVSPSMEAAFDFIEYRLAIVQRRRQRAKSKDIRFEWFSPAGRYNASDEIHVTDMAG
jgi:hypothetical protein